VLAYALGLGQLSKISVENLDQQASDVRETRAAAFAATGRRGGSCHAAGTVTAICRQHTQRRADGAPRRSVRSRWWRSPPARASPRSSGLRRAQVCHGGQTANPSTGELLEAVKSVDADEVLLLPNNPNVVLARRQVPRCRQPVAVVATRNAAEGFAALLALDPDKSAARERRRDDRGRPRDPVAVGHRGGSRRDRERQEGEEGPDDRARSRRRPRGRPRRPVDCGPERDPKLSPGFELITVYYGDGGDLAGTEALARRSTTSGPGAEVEVLHGGQPHYRYLISAE
jgi:dihydroxyacetone kinase-like predicted kinase